MTGSSRALLVFALVAIVILGNPDSAQAQRRNRSNRDESNNNQNNADNNADNSGGNNDESQRGKRRNRNRENNVGSESSDVQQLQQIIQGGQNGQGNENNAKNSQQPRRRRQQGGQESSHNQHIQQFLGNDEHHRGDHWHSNKFKRHDELRNWVIGFNGGPRPFTNTWYKNHPHAWHHHHHHDDDFWKVATAASVIGWLGWQNHPHHHTTIVYDPVPVDAYLADGQPSDVIDSDAPGEWLELGAFTLLTGADDPGTRVLQLSIDKHGHVRGSYYDMITNSTQNVYGVIDQNSQQVRWTLETNRKLTFVAPLDQLTQSQGVVNVKLPGGQVQQWQLVRMEDAGN